MRYKRPLFRILNFAPSLDPQFRDKEIEFALAHRRLRDHVHLYMCMDLKEQYLFFIEHYEIHKFIFVF